MANASAPSAKHQKVAILVWTIDPEGKRRFLLRHNKPFGDHKDEWEIVFGSIEPDEDKAVAAIREVQEELGISDYVAFRDLEYSTEYIGRHGPTIVYYFAMQIADIAIQIVLNEESIGYDWVLLEKARRMMLRDDETRVLEMVS